MPQICDPITAPLEDFDLVVEALDETVRYAGCDRRTIPAFESSSDCRRSSGSEIVWDEFQRSLADQGSADGGRNELAYLGEALHCRGSCLGSSEIELIV